MILKKVFLLFFYEMNRPDHEPKAFSEFMESSGLKFNLIATDFSLNRCFFECIGRKSKNWNLEFKKKGRKLNDVFDERLSVDWYVNSGQRKRYLKSLNKKKVEVLLDIVISETNLAKTFANTSYS